MRRIAVIGNGGRGKSALARALGQHLGSDFTAKLVHLRSSRDIPEWLAKVTRTTVEVVD